MSTRIKILIGSLVAIAFFISMFFMVFWANDGLSTRMRDNDLIGVRFAIIDDQKENGLEAIAQLIIFPEQNKVLMYFVNSDARLEEDGKSISTMNPSTADFFTDITEVRNTYYIHIHKNNLIRVIDILGGMTLFFEEPKSFDQGSYNHLQGVRYYSGEQYLEYMLSTRTTQPDRVWLNGIERLQRIESMLMNLIWRRSMLLKNVDSKELGLMLKKLFESNFAAEELDVFFKLIANDKTHFLMIEVPLEARKYKAANVLLIKEKSARNLFTKIKEDIQGQSNNDESFPVEVLNGTQTGGLARRIKQFLQDRGLQVLNADNYAYKPVVNSIIVERTADSAKAEHLMELTGLKRERVVFNKSYIDVDASLIIGDDFKINQLKLK